MLSPVAGFARQLNENDIVIPGKGQEFDIVVRVMTIADQQLWSFRANGWKKGLGKPEFSDSILGPPTFGHRKISSLELRLTVN